ncbi:MAG: DUF1232 domain-containing protein [Bacillota bacterium]|jgi:uncharacterized membrane protein YkvA (DUF1232 family)|nr:DUF1232 domain-containing protein [Eubacteriales bacterium]MDD3536968.1 DUF1232 domain-containing protein [Eubacteriales bacterium]MDI9492584.1 DUF1232 domain-containing protein [Bacillota bacterium]HPF19122.1 DUF1232 domain-containing protein [Bacillota bacterium]HRV33748.1 DUF1232 domain-containing protein [Anaerovoracaceae bacterium]
MGFLSIYILKKRIFAIKPMMKDPAVSVWKKVLIVAGLVYLFLPFDLIPPIIPVFGFFDDMILWGFIISYLKDELDRYWVDDRAGGAPADQFSGKNIVDNVDYTVEEETFEEIKE